VRRHPGVTLDFTVHNREGLLARIAQNLTDLAIMVRPPTDMDTVDDRVRAASLRHRGGTGHPLARVRAIPRARILREPIIVREKGSDTWKSMEESFGPDAQDIDVAMEIASTETIKQAVIAGMGVAFLSAHTLADELAAGSLAVLDVEGFPVMRHWYIVHRRGKRLPPVAQAFKDFLLADARRLMADIVSLPRRHA
jgi:DNA-binding transcriptional LysR family regulator